MILLWLIVIPAAGGLLAWIMGRLNSSWPRWAALAAMTADLIVGVIFAAERMSAAGIEPGGPWLAEIQIPWIPRLGIGFFLAADGLGLMLALLTAFLGIMTVAAAWKEIKERTGFFYFNLLWTLAGITGVFLALDLFLFYFFYEMMLLPMYFIIAIWGHENRVYASSKFFLFTQVSSLLMLLAILGLFFLHGRSTGVYTFNFVQLLGTSLASSTATWLMLGFWIAFVVKLPVVPFHSWLPDAYMQAPTAGSVILAGLLAKTGAYGLLRFVVPLFPAAAADFSPIAMALAVASILYGALQAFGQTDLKRLIAYTSVSHMGFILLGVFAWNRIALDGVVIQILAHGISTGAMFILAGALEERIGTRDLDRMGGLWAVIPRMGAAMMLFALASMGLPGLGNFIGEFLVLLGTFRVSVPLAVAASFGFIASCIYSLWIVQRTFHGPNREGWMPPDLSIRETAVLAIMAATIVWLGLFPQPVFTFVSPALERLERVAVHGALSENIATPSFRRKPESRNYAPFLFDALYDPTAKHRIPTQPFTLRYRRVNEVIRGSGSAALTGLSRSCFYTSARTVGWWSQAKEVSFSFNSRSATGRLCWIPAFAGMTENPDNPILARPHSRAQQQLSAGFTEGGGTP